MKQITTLQAITDWLNTNSLTIAIVIVCIVFIALIATTFEHSWLTNILARAGLIACYSFIALCVVLIILNSIK